MGIEALADDVVVVDQQDSPALLTLGDDQAKSSNWPNRTACKRVDVSRDLGRIPNDVIDVASQIVREATSNALRHSVSPTVEIAAGRSRLPDSHDDPSGERLRPCFGRVRVGTIKPAKSS
jgi:hypothetical protein